MTEIGYSGTPLAKKLGIKERMVIQALHSPKPYIQFFHDFPMEVVVEENTPFSHQADLIHFFVTSEKELKSGFKHVLKHLKKTGAAWVSWPKRTSGIPTEVDKYPIMKYGLDVGLVDVKVAAIDQVWSGLKFMYRLKDR